MSRIIDFPKREQIPGRKINENTIIFEEQGGYGVVYKYRATRKRIGSFDIIAIDWMHPNFGVWYEDILWILSPHLQDWRPYPITTDSQKYANSEEFLKDFPQFKELFAFEGRYDPYHEIVEQLERVTCKQQEKTEKGEV